MHQVPVQATFRLQKPVSLLVEHTSWLEHDIYEEIGVPNTNVSIISMHPLAANLTKVVFGVVPYPSNVAIPSVTLSVLRSSLIELVLQQLNLSLTPSVFGQSSSFEVLKFPGGITVIPNMQYASIWQTPQILFNFTLHNSVSQIQENLEVLKGQLKYGLQLRSYETIFVKVTNMDGSTVAPPVIVQASVLSDVAGHVLLPQRLKQLAEALTGHPVKNLGLDHSVFGKVKQIRLSTFLQASLGSPQGSPSPSPSPSEENHYSAPPQSHYPTVSPSHAPAPSADRHSPSPCDLCDSSSPSESVSPPIPTPKNWPEPPTSPDSESPTPSVIDGHSPSSSPCRGPTLSPNPSPAAHSDPPAPSGFSPHSAISPRGQPPSPTPKLDPHISPSPAVRYGPSPQEQGSGEASVYSMPASSPIAPFPASYVAGPSYNEMRLIGLLGFMVFLLCVAY
ncbi:verprolin-like isoform X3 [Magnolia sinica]|uniref:verprolin-like isoform X3 n=1 Tax=Magnolia sinica TaxID=86752 RepID=UPI0026583ECC|nr:verprolin-like isoform X3 [Magnolia sinica]